MAFKLFQIKTIPSLPVSIRLFCFFLSSISFAYTAWNQNFSWKLCKHTANNNYLRIYSPPITCNLHLKSVKWVKMSCWMIHSWTKHFEYRKSTAKRLGAVKIKLKKKKIPRKRNNFKWVFYFSSNTKQQADVSVACDEILWMAKSMLNVFNELVTWGTSIAKVMLITK